MPDVQRRMTPSPFLLPPSSSDADMPLRTLRFNLFLGTVESRRHASSCISAFKAWLWLCAACRTRCIGPRRHVEQARPPSRRTYLRCKTLRRVWLKAGRPQPDAMRAHASVSFAFKCPVAGSCASTSATTTQRVHTKTTGRHKEKGSHCSCHAPLAFLPRLWFRHLCLPPAPPLPCAAALQLS